MKSDKKYIISLLLLFLLMGLTFFLLFRHFEFDEIWSNIHSASAGPLLIAVLMVPVYLLCYGGVMRLFLRSFGYSAGLLRCASYGCIDFYYSAITPSSTGGQPMVIYHMGKDGVPMSKSVLAPLVHTVLYKTVLILFTVAGLICYPVPRLPDGRPAADAGRLPAVDVLPARHQAHRRRAHQAAGEAAAGTEPRKEDGRLRDVARRISAGRRACEGA